MTPEEARRHAAGYAAGREDASGIKTYSRVNQAETGFAEFGVAYGQAQATYETRGYMLPAKVAYDAWQRTGGLTIFPDNIIDARVNSRPHACSGNWDALGTNSTGHYVFQCDGTSDRHVLIDSHYELKHVCTEACESAVIAIKESDVNDWIYS